MRYNNAIFIKSAANIVDLPEDQGREIAIAGRSNAGKSSAINTITGIKALAKTSKTPGRTQLINFFALEQDNFLVDLPGYGFAKVPAAVKTRWQHTLTQYIATRQALKGIVLVMDIRHPLKPMDWQMLEWCIHYEHKIHILLTKADKLTKNSANATLFSTQKQLQKYTEHVSIQKFSAITKEGLTEIHTKLDEWFK